MSNQPPGPSDEPLEVRSNLVRGGRHPDLHTTQSAVLKDGKLCRKEAVYTVVVDRHTGEFHHNALTIKTTLKRKAGDREDGKHTVGLTDEDGDEIQRLLDFLLSVRGGAVPGDAGRYLVLPAAGVVDPRSLLLLVAESTAAGRADVLTEVLRLAAKDVGLFGQILERAKADPQLFEGAATAIKLATYRQAVASLRALVESKPGVREDKFQQLLARHPWMFGSEYSELLPRRTWTRDESQDYVLRRTTDGYVEVVEIKTTLDGTPLFRHDPSHDSDFPAAPLSAAVGQVMKYIERLDAERNSIRANDGEDFDKVRAKVVIGRDGDAGQRAALRRFNGHLHRIEVLTFDQLLRIAENVLGYLQTRSPAAPPAAPVEGDIPF